MQWTGCRAVSVPDESDLAQRLLVEHLDPFGDVAPAEARVEGKRVLVVLKRPDHHSLQAVLGKLAARGPEQLAAEADALVFRLEVEFVDFALLRQFARAVAPDGG